MATYAKPKRTRTMERGLRPFSIPTQDTFSQKEIQKMAEFIEKILTNSRVLGEKDNEKDNWLLDQALIAVAFRLAKNNEERNKITQEMKKHRERGHLLGFSETEIKAINRVVLQQDLDGQLESFHQRLWSRREKG